MHFDHDGERAVAWVDYLLASREPADHALLDELLARSWAYSEIMQWMMRHAEKGNLTEEMLARTTKKAALCEATQGRIHQRGLELQRAGIKPVGEATAMAWQSRRSRLCAKRIDPEHEVYRS